MADEQLLKTLHDREYFFDNGIQFSCQKCGGCCTGEPGIIYVTDEEIDRIADYMELEREIFVSHCLYPYRKGHSIREDETGRCIFYENGCAIYDVRPLQCQSFPFWFHAMRSKDIWKHTTGKCPGMNKGKLYTKDEILQILAASFYLYEAMKEDLP